MSNNRIWGALTVSLAAVGSFASGAAALDDVATATPPEPVYARFLVSASMADFPQGVQNMFGPDSVFGGVFYMTSDIDPDATVGYQRVLDVDGDPQNIVPVFCVLESTPFDLSRSQVAPGAVLPLDLYERFDPDQPATVVLSSPSNDSVTAVLNEGTTMLVAGTTQENVVEFPSTDVDVFIDRVNATGQRTRLTALTTGSIIQVSAMASHPDGGFVAAGHGDGPFDGPPAGGTDVFVTRFTNDGQVSWTRTLGSSGADTATAVLVSTAGEITVFGTAGAALPTETSAGSSDVFAARFSADGTRTWVKQWGTAGSDNLTDVSPAVVDTGFVVSATTTGTWPNSTSPNAGGLDAVVEKVDASAEQVWVVQSGTAGQDSADSLAVAGDGSVVAVGSTTADLFSANSGGTDAYVRQISGTGVPQSETQFGSVSDDNAVAVLIDGTEAVLAGTTSGTLGTASTGGRDVYVRRVAGDGSTVWTTQLGSASDDSASVLAAFNGGVLVGGETSGVMFGGFNRGGSDTFAALLDTTGVLQWGRSWGAGQESTVPAVGSGVFAVPAAPAVQDLEVFISGIDTDGNPLQVTDRYAVVPAYASKPLSAARDQRDPQALGQVRWLAPRVSLYDSTGDVVGVVGTPDDPTLAVGTPLPGSVPAGQRTPVEFAAGQLAMWQLLSGRTVDDPAGSIELYRAATRDTFEQLIGQGGTFMSEPSAATLDAVADRAVSLVAAAEAATAPVEQPHAFDVYVTSVQAPDVDNSELLTVSVTAQTGAQTAPAAGVAVTVAGSDVALSGTTSESGVVTVTVERTAAAKAVEVTVFPVLPAGSLLAAVDDNGPASAPARLMQQVVTARDLTLSRSLDVTIPAVDGSGGDGVPGDGTDSGETPATTSPSSTVPGPDGDGTIPDVLPNAGNMLGWWVLVVLTGSAGIGLWLRRRMS